NVGAAGNHVKGVRDDTRHQERLAVGVKVEPPGIAGTLGEDLELAGCDVVTPHRRSHLDPANLRLAKYAVEAIQPAVRAPLQGVEGFMGVLAAEALQQNFVVIAAAGPARIAKIEEIGRSPQEDAAMADLDAAGQVKAGQ